MGFQLGGRALPSPSQQMETGPVKGVGVHKRAYAQLAISTNVEQFVTCGGSMTIESPTKMQGTHANLFSKEGARGSRIAPVPSLESVTVSCDGGQDMSDAMLFQADMTVKVYSSKDFDTLDKAFMTPRRRVTITIGYVAGSTYTLEAEITGFNFTINSDLTYDVTLKAAGAQDGLIEADYTTLRKDGPPPETYIDPETRKRVTSTDVITNFLARMAYSTSEARTRGTDGEARYDRSTKMLVVNHQMAEGFELVLPNYLGGFGIDFNDNVVTYMSLQNLIDEINKNAGTVDGIPDKLFDSSELIYTPDTSIASASPTEMLFGWNVKYGDTNYRGTPNTGGMLERVWIGQTLIQGIYDGLKKPPGKDDTPQRVSTSTLLKKVFASIETNSGGHMKLFLYADPDKCEDGRFLILNKGKAAKKGPSLTTINVADGYKKGVRDISLTSNLDSELIALATAAAMDGEGAGHLNTVFPGCYAAASVSNRGTTKADLKQKMLDVQKAIGDEISDNEIAQLKAATKAYVRFQDKEVNPVIPYGLECEVTCDGYGGPKYGDAFTVDRLPARLREDGIYFAVTKIGQNFSGGDWTTNFNGLMMIGAS